MFDIGFWELVLLGVVGLVVLGPERLPVVARTLGRWVARAKRYANTLTEELENEVGAADLRRDVREARESIESQTREFRDEISGFRSDAEQAVKPLADQLESDFKETRDIFDETDAAPPASVAEDQGRDEMMATEKAGASLLSNDADKEPSDSDHSETRQ